MKPSSHTQFSRHILAPGFLARAAGLVVLLSIGLACVATVYGNVAALALFGAGSLLIAPKVGYSLGAAATAARNTDRRPGNTVNLPVAAATTIYKGTLVAKDANGRAVPASDTAGLRTIGLATETVDNSAGAAGALTIDVELGVFKFANSATNAIDQNDVGKMAEIEDDQTVAEDSNEHVSAGRVLALDDDGAGVWIDTRFAYYGPKKVIALTSTDGTAAGAADLPALKTEAEKIGDDVRALHASLFG
ncbi:MAG: hypothetical protein HZA93_23990 [Verrucomicrobia bacterium]|nr:hypothetical protein [Verrucomicrobiota bacterium]